MSDDNFEIGFGVKGDGEAKRALGDVAAAQDRLTKSGRSWASRAQAMDEAGSKLHGTMSELGPVFAAAGASLAGTIAAYTGAAAAAVAFTREMERQAGIFNRFNGNIGEATRRTNGLVSDLQAMQIANRLAARGIQLTGEDMANVMVRIVETSAATGEEIESVAGRMTEALGGASAEALQQFNISVRQGSTQAEAFDQALEQLNDTTGDLSSTTDTLGGRINQLNTAWENAKTRTFEVVASTRVLEDTFTGLFNAITGGQGTFEDAMDSMLDSVVLFASGATLALQQYMRWATIVVRAMRAMADLEFELADNLWQQAGAVQQEQTEAFYNGGFAAQAQFNADRATENINARREGGPEQSTRAQGAASRSGSGAAAAARNEAMEQSWLDDVEYERRMLEESENNHRAYMNQLDEVWRQVAANRRERMNQEREARQEAYEHQVEIANRERALYAQQQNEMIERANQWRDVNNQIIQTSLNEVISLSGQMVKQLIAASDLSQDAFLAQLDAFLEATAIEYTLRSLAEAANAVAAAARYDYAAAAQHGVASALAGAVATATGVASLGISTPSAPTGGGAASQVGPGASPGGGGGANITVQLYSPNAVFTEAEQGRMLRGIERSTRRALGGSGRGA